MGSRSRSRNVDVAFAGVRQTYASSGTVGETMSDVTGARINHPCTHNRRSITSGGLITYTHSLLPHLGSIKEFPSPANPGRGAGWECGTSVYVQRPSPASPPPVEDALNRMNSDLCDYIREAGRSSLHAISFVRELSEAISMIRNPFKILDFVRHHAGLHPKSRTSLKKAFKRAHSNASQKGLVDRASDTWLEGTYGWNPFVSDVLAAAELLGSANQSRRQLAAQGNQTFRYQKGGTTTVKTAPFSAGANDFYAYCSEYTADISWKVVYYGDMVVNPSVESEGALLSMLRSLNLDRLGYAVWDAVPYSFVVDWFLPLGAKIDDALSGPAFYTMVSSPWASSRVYRTDKLTFNGNSKFNSAYVKYAGSAFLVEKSYTFTRGPINMDSLATNSPTGMHGTRIASGLALAWGRLAR